MTKGITTRDRIIQESAKLFNVYGYHRCSLQDIMEATKLKKGGIYNHFKNKDEIAIEAFNFSFQKVFKRFRERLSICTSATEKLYAIVEVFEEYIDDRVFIGGCPIINTAIDTTDSYPLLREKANEALKMLETYISIKVREGVENHEFKAHLDCDEIAAFLLSTFEGAVVLSRLNNDKKYMRVAIKYIFEYIKREIVI